MIYLDEPIGDDLSTSSKEVEVFESELNRLLYGTETQHVVATNSGTAALRLTALLLPFRTALIPTLTFVATANAFALQHKDLVFCDVDIDTWCLDTSELTVENIFEYSIDCVVPVHLYGVAADMCRLTERSRLFGFKIIEDAAESLGAEYCNYSDSDGCMFPVGTIGHMGVLSFNRNKIITTGGGGALLLNGYYGLRDRVRSLIRQARDNNNDNWTIGDNLAMTGMAATAGVAQLKNQQGLIKERVLFNGKYREALSKWCIFQQPTTPLDACTAWFTAFRFKDELGDIDIPLLQEQLRELGIPTRRVFRPLHTLTPYADVPVIGDMSNAEKIYARGLCLPSSNRNSIQGIENVCEKLRTFFSERFA